MILPVVDLGLKFRGHWQSIRGFRNCPSTSSHRAKHASTEGEKQSEERKGKIRTRYRHWFLREKKIFKLLTPHLPNLQGNAVPDHESKKPRRSPRISSQLQQDAGYLPSPLVNEVISEEKREVATVSPPEGRRNQAPRGQSPDESSCPTQGFSQYPPIQSIDDVEDEVAQGIWGYLTPLDNNFGGQLVLKKRDSTNTTPVIGAASDISTPESTTSKRGTREINRAGYLIGRHAECGMSYPSHTFRGLVIHC